MQLNFEKCAIERRTATVSAEESLDWESDVQFPSDGISLPRNDVCSRNSRSVSVCFYSTS